MLHTPPCIPPGWWFCGPGSTLAPSALRKHHWLTGNCWPRRHFQISVHFRLYHFRHLLCLTRTPSSPSVARRILLGPISNGHPSVPPEVSAAPGQENQNASDKMYLQIGNRLLEVSWSRWREHNAQPQGNTPPCKLKPRPPLLAVVAGRK